jgi:hypothetical protein
MQLANDMQDPIDGVDKGGNEFAVTRKWSSVSLVE